jgi:hypothetical protein
MDGCGCEQCPMALALAVLNIPFLLPESYKLSE